jgi:hypothetical protein
VRSGGSVSGRGQVRSDCVQQRYNPSQLQHRIGRWRFEHRHPETLIFSRRSLTPAATLTVDNVIDFFNVNTPFVRFQPGVIVRVPATVPILHSHSRGVHAGFRVSFPDHAMVMSIRSSSQTTTSVLNGIVNVRVLNA